MLKTFGQYAGFRSASYCAYVQVLDEINEQTDQMQQIQDAMAQPIGPAADVDEDELMGELEVGRRSQSRAFVVCLLSLSVWWACHLMCCYSLYKGLGYLIL